MAQKKVLLIGLDPNQVDFSRSREFSAEKVRAAGGAAQSTLSGLGYEVHSCLIDSEEAGEAAVHKILAEHRFDCIMVGAGIRVLPDNFRMFENLINLLHQGAPAAKICFNTNPNDTAEAVQRWA
jgi:hypothetical protein